jgi:hypothetical protein
MSAASNLQFTWKRMAEEREETARNLGRIAIGLFVACNVLAFTTYSGHSRFGELCQRIDGINPSLARSIDLKFVANLEAIRAECQ